MTSSERPATHFMGNRHWDHHRMSGEIASSKMDSYSNVVKEMDTQDDHSSDGSEAGPIYLSGKSATSSGCSGIDRYMTSMEADNSEHKSSSLLDDQARRYRTNYSRSQIARLEDEFRREKYLSRPRRCELASELGLKETTIKVWFQNRRMKEKRQMASLALPVFANADPNLYAFLMESASAYLNYTANKSSLPTPTPSQSDIYNPFNGSQGPTIPNSSSSSSSMPPFTPDHASAKVASANLLMSSQPTARFPPVGLPIPGMGAASVHHPHHPLLSYESNLRHTIDQIRLGHHQVSNHSHPALSPFSGNMPYFLHPSLQQNSNCSLPLPLIKFPPSVSPINGSADNLNKYSSQENQLSALPSGFPSLGRKSPHDSQPSSPKKKLFRPFIQNEDN